MRNIIFLAVVLFTSSIALAQSKELNADGSFDRLLNSYGGSGDTLDYAKVSKESRERYDRFSQMMNMPAMPASGTVTRAEYAVQFNKRMEALRAPGGVAADAKNLDKLQEREAALAKELAEVRREIALLKSAKPAAPAKVYTDAKSLLAGLPEADFPKSGNNGSVERARADRWLAKNLPGRVIEWTEKIADVGEGRSGTGFRVGLAAGRKRYGLQSASRDEVMYLFDQSVKVGPETCTVFLAYFPSGIIVDRSHQASYTIATGQDEDVLRLRKLKGQDVKFRATITGAGLNESRTFDLGERPARLGAVPEADRPSELPITLQLGDLTIDGHVYSRPAAAAGRNPFNAAPERR